MIRLVLKTMALTEVRLRMRRMSTIVALLAVAAITWAMIDDPAAGGALLVVDNTRVLYTSSALALGSASLASLLFEVGGFFLARGRVPEDIRSGAGGVIGATPVGSLLFRPLAWRRGLPRPADARFHGHGAGLPRLARRRPDPAAGLSFQLLHHALALRVLRRQLRRAFR